MLWLERRIVAALAGTDDDLARGEISEFVGSTLAAMPQHLRLGVAAESIALGGWVRLRSGSRPDATAIEQHLDSWEHCPIGVVRLYPRLLRSLVLLVQQDRLQA